MVTRNLPPVVGGMERLMQRTLSALCRVVTVDLIGPVGVRAWVPPTCRVLAELPFGAAAFLPSATALTLRHAGRRRYQLCLGGSGLMAPALWAARQQGACTAVYLHGTDLAYEQAVYQRLFVASLAKVPRVIANSRYTGALAVAKGISASSIRVVNPGVDLPATIQRPPESSPHRPPTLLAVGRLVARKGIAEFVEQVMPRLLRQQPDLRLRVVGTEPPGSRQGQQARIQAAASRLVTPDAVQLLGAVDDQELHRLYAESDLHVLPALERRGDVEGFGMVVLEAAAHGLPTVAFDVGGIADALLPGAGGRLIAATDYPQMAEAIMLELRQAGTERRQALIAATEQRSWKRFDRQLLEALQLQV